MRIGFFTAGDVGAGHIIRGIAIRRALERAGFGGEYRMFGPPIPFPGIALPDWCPVTIDPRQLYSRFRAPVTELAIQLEAFRPDVLVVDQFWGPLRFVLPLRGCEAWLLLRSFPSDWLVGSPGAPFDPRQYRQIVAIEPGLEGPFTDRIDPVVVANREDCQPPGALRARLGIRPGERLVVVMQAGRLGEADALRPAGDRVVTFDLYAPDPLFPACEWLGDADAIHCGAGYASFWEAHWLGWVERTHFRAFDRLGNDDQAWRLGLRGAPMRANGADMLARRLSGR